METPLKILKTIVNHEKISDEKVHHTRKMPILVLSDQRIYFIVQYWQTIYTYKLQEIVTSKVKKQSILNVTECTYLFSRS